MRYRDAAWGAALLVLGSCGSAGEQPALPSSLVLAQDGLVEVGAQATRRIAFGMPMQTVLAQVRRAGAYDIAAEVKADECPGAMVQVASWGDGLALLFADGRFRGWISGHPLLTTAQGVGVGSPRAQLMRTYRAQVSRSEFGPRFRTNGANGFTGSLSSMNADATVTTLAAGLDCPFAPE